MRSCDSIMFKPTSYCLQENLAPKTQVLLWHLPQISSAFITAFCAWAARPHGCFDQTLAAPSPFTRESPPRIKQRPHSNLDHYGLPCTKPQPPCATPGPQQMPQIPSATLTAARSNSYADVPQSWHPSPENAAAWCTFGPDKMIPGGLNLS